MEGSVNLKDILLVRLLTFYAPLGSQEKRWLWLGNLDVLPILKWLATSLDHIIRPPAVFNFKSHITEKKQMNLIINELLILSIVMVTMIWQMVSLGSAELEDLHATSPCTVCNSILLSTNKENINSLSWDSLSSFRTWWKIPSKYLANSHPNGLEWYSRLSWNVGISCGQWFMFWMIHFWSMPC